MNTVLYARVSTDKQADLSIPAQLDAMRAYAHQHKWTVAEEFIEPGVSGKTTERPALQRLLTRIRDIHTKTDVVLVHKIDRLARNVYDHATIKALLTQRKIQLASVVENVDDTVPGQLVENIMASIAQFYSANLSEEVKKGMRQKVMNGGWPHLPPCGYVSVKNPDGRGARVEVHPHRGPLVTQAFELYGTGHFSLKALGIRMAKEGLVSRSGLPLPLSQLKRILTNRFYLGRIVWNGLDVPAKHKPLVSDAVFERVQNALQFRHRHVGIKGSVKGFILRGIAICAECRGRMTGEQHDKWSYYRCSRQSYKRESCAARFCRTDLAHEGAERACRQLQITRSTANAIFDEAKQVLAKRPATVEALHGLVERQRAELNKAELVLTEEFSVGRLSTEAFRERVAYLTEQRVSLDRMNRTTVPAEQLTRRLRQTLDLATSLYDLYQPLDEASRHSLLRSVFQTIVLGPEGLLGFTLNPPFDQLHKGKSLAPGPVAEQLIQTLEVA